jgi:hypothetical protein
MGLSAPLALLAAALVALPIAAHLIRRADVRRRSLPTVAFLARVMVRDRRRARVTEPWLLALRVAAVLLAILALAGPFVVERLAYGDGSTIALSIVLDDSLSMAQRSAPSQPTAFDRARAHAREVVRALGEGSEVALVLAGTPPRLAVPRTSDREALLRALDGLDVGARTTDLAGALELAGRQLASARLGDRRAIVLSDFAGLEAPALTLRGPEVDLYPVGAERPPTNVGVADARASSDPLVEGGWSVAVELLASPPDAPAVEVALTAELPGASPARLELARASVPLERGRGRTVLRFRPPDGLVTATVRLVDHEDALALDDARVVSLAPPAATRVVLVEPSGLHTARFAARALASIPPESGGFLVTTVDADRLGGGRTGTIDPGQRAQPDPLAGADVVVLAGAGPTSPAALEALRVFVEGGGGLLVAPSRGLRTLDLEPLAELLPARAGEVVTAGPSASPVVAGARPLLPPGPTGLEGLVAQDRLSLRAPQEGVALAFADGAPLLVLDDTARRAVLAVGVDDAMSDLPLRVGFVPAMISLVSALARPGALPDRPFHAGEVPALRVDPDVSRVEIVTPAGEVVERAPSDGAVPLGDLAQPGAYTIRAHDAGGVRELSRALLVVVPPAAEVDLTAHVPEQSAPRADAAVDGEARTPVERWVFALVGLLALIEGFARLRRGAASPARPTA